MKLILVRHGETQMNRDGRIQGHHDLSLNETGLRQADQVARTLLKEAPFTLYSSPLARALETAQVISKAIGAPVAQLDGLKEVDAGNLEGLTGQEMRQRFPEFMRAWHQDAGSAQMPGGESLAQLQVRAWDAIIAILQDNTDGKAVAVTHNFTILTIICKVLGLPLASFRRLKVDLGSLTTLEMTGSEAFVVSLNDRCHLSQEPGRRNQICANRLTL